MDEVERLIGLLRRTDQMSSVESRMSALATLDRLRDARVVPFLLQLLAEEVQETDIRIQLVRLLRNGRLTPDERPQVARVLVGLLSTSSGTNVRLGLQAALVLGEFTDIPGTLAALGTTALAEEPVDLRYAAFTSLERAGPTAECVALLRQLSGDETLGRSARSVLSAWRVE